MKARGFTLIELLIVIAIVGILVALVLPHLQGGTVNSPTSIPRNAQVVPDQVDVTACRKYTDSNGTVLSCPDGKFYQSK